MSEQELYEIARRQVDRRNRRRTLWAIDLAGMIIYIGVFIVITLSAFSKIALFGLLAWIAVFVLHTIIFGLAESRESDIANEVARLREGVYEKPKRLELGEDGELVDVDEMEEDGDVVRKRKV
jgi:hypothetical protein